MNLSLGKSKELTRLIYASLGEWVIYTPKRGTAVSIIAIVTRQSELGPPGVTINLADGQDYARIMKEDVVLPTRGDTITDAEATVYRIEDVDNNFNESEHEVQLRKTG